MYCCPVKIPETLRPPTVEFRSMLPLNVSVDEEPEATVAPPLRRTEAWSEEDCWIEPELLTVKMADPLRVAGRLADA
jgi:hypothetical protein